MKSNYELQDNLFSTIQNYKLIYPDINIKKLTNLFENFIYCFESYLNKNENNDWNDVTLKIYYHVNNIPELQNEKKLNSISNLMEKEYLKIFEQITQKINTVSENGQFKHNTNSILMNKLNKAYSKEFDTTIQNLFSIKSIIIRPNLKKPSFIIKISPLTSENGGSYYKVTVKIFTGSSFPLRWTEKNKKLYWESLINHIRSILKQFDDSISEEKDDFLPVPYDSPVESENKLIKISLRVELQKFGKKPDYKKMTNLQMFLSNPENKELEQEIHE